MRAIRSVVIDQIIATIIECEKRGLEIDEDKFILEISTKFYCSKRTAREYLESARERRSHLNIYFPQYEN